MPEEVKIVNAFFIELCEEEPNFEDLEKDLLIKIEILKELYEEFE